MIKFYTILTCFLFSSIAKAQYYYPPLTGNTWQIVSPSSLNWNLKYIDSLYTYLEKVQSKSFIVLVNGNIVLEKYFNNSTADSLRYWASAGKTLTNFCIGVCKSQSLLKLTDSSSKYLGTGWTSLTPEQEKNISIKNQLTMTTGLSELVSFDCTLPSCLKYLAPPGQRWSYHNSPYTLLDKVIENASGKTLNKFVADNISLKTGINGQYIKSGFNTTFISKPRVFARFGLLLLSKGYWNGQNIIGDSAFLRESIQTQNPQNQSYGYLTWLNGKNSYMLPGLNRTVINESLTPSAPNDAYFALGKNWQALHIIPSLNMVIARMGDNPEPDSSTNVSLIPNEIVWQWMKKILPTNKISKTKINLPIVQNTTNQTISVTNQNVIQMQLISLSGKVINQTSNNIISYQNATTGIYIVTTTLANGQHSSSQVSIQ